MLYLTQATSQGHLLAQIELEEIRQFLYGA
jgi:hypothetical protein